MTGLVDLVGSTANIRFHGTHVHESATALSDRPLVFDKASLPAFAALSERGVTVTAMVGCPMLRLENMPSDKSCDALVEQCVDEFATAALADAVWTSVDEDKIDTAKEDHLHEWLDAPVCCVVRGGAAATAAAVSVPWSTTAMALDFIPLHDDDYDFGNRLNNIALATVRHNFPRLAFTLFCGPHRDIDFALLKDYKYLFQNTQWFFESTSEQFRAHKSGIYIFSASAQVAASAVPLVKQAVARSLGGSCATWLRNEREPWPNVSSMEKVKLLHSSTIDGWSAENVGELLFLAVDFPIADNSFLRIVRQLVDRAPKLRLLQFCGTSGVPAEFLHDLLSAHNGLVVEISPLLDMPEVAIALAAKLTSAIFERACA